MNIGGFQKQSFIDYPHLISAVIFTNGCNLSCWYCHNKSLINGQHKSDVTLEQIYNFLKERKGFLDAVVISGGEPTLQPDIEEVINKIKSMGFKVKLDTNGTNPEILEKLLPKLDYVAMDIKNSFAKMPSTICNNNKKILKNIKKSINVLLKSGKNYEFRTTFAPDIEIDDVKKIAKYVKGAKNFYLQTYVPNTKTDTKKHTSADFEIAIAKIRQYIKNSFIR